MRMTEEQYQDLLRRNVRTQAPSLQEYAALTPQQKRPKYGNRKVTDAAGGVHDSTKEYRRWCDLELRQRAGEISDLHRQPVFDLVVNDVLVCKYEADSSYRENGALVVEDVKSIITRKNRAYRIKIKLMKAIHKLEVREI